MTAAVSPKNSVLVVDDEENLVVLLERILLKEGFNVKTATGFYKALDLLDEHNFDLAILDIKMSPLDGVALLSEIRKRAPSVKVVMMTGYPTAEVRDECLKLGASMFLAKPIDIQKLKTLAHDLAGA